MPVELPPAPVRIYELTLLELRGCEARLRAHCSGGTYMRSIAHDLGQALGCGAHLRELRRIASAEFTLEQARTIPRAAATGRRESPGGSADPGRPPAAGFPYRLRGTADAPARSDRAAIFRFRLSACSKGPAT